MTEKEDKGKKEDFGEGFEEKKKENESNLLENDAHSEGSPGEGEEEEGDYEEEEEIE